MKIKKNSLKKVTILLLIIVIILISFVGVYEKQLNKMVNTLPEYKFGMDFSDIREVRLNVREDTVTKYYDENGNEVDMPDDESESTNITSKEVPVNSEEKLTAENFAKTKKILEDRLDALYIEEYQIRQDENGYIVVELPENDDTDFYVETLMFMGKFEIKDSETNEVLLDNSNISDAFATTYSSDGKNMAAYLIINFDQEGKQKFEDITKTYIATTDEEGNETKKVVTVSIDDQTIASTYFGKTMSNGQLQLKLGSETTSSDTLLTYYRETLMIANSIRYGQLPIEYTVENQEVLLSTVRQDVVQVLWIIGAVLIVILVAYLIIRFNKGLLIGISWIGFIGMFLLLIRYSNSVITINSIVGMVVICIYQYVFLNAVLSNKQNRSFKEILAKYSIYAIPLYIIAVIFTFASKLAVNSFGMALFWGSAIMAVYNLLITKNLIDEK
ncbi:MAG: hypothetical protein IKP28_01395 [Clostridia bacterium]|nr:hypothetical protein [Clostridia bacterium]